MKVIAEVDSVILPPAFAIVLVLSASLHDQFHACRQQNSFPHSPHLPAAPQAVAPAPQASREGCSSNGRVFLISDG